MKNYSFIAGLTIFFFTALPLGVLAADTIKTFQQLPWLADAGQLTTEAYINALYRIAISVAAILVVLRMIWSGVKLMFSESVSGRKNAREDFQNALLGLVIILGAVTILQTINPRLNDTAILSRLQSSPAGEMAAPNNARSPAYQHGAPETMTSCAPVSPSGGVSHNGVNVSTASMMMEATDRAEQCGGTWKRITDGNFQVTCPAGSGMGASGPSQLSGFPIGCSQPLDAVTAQNQCSAAGGSPSISSVGIPPRTIINCYP